MFTFDPFALLFLFFLLLGVVPNLFYAYGYMDHIKRKWHFWIHYVAFVLLYGRRSNLLYAAELSFLLGDYES